MRKITIAFIDTALVFKVYKHKPQLLKDEECDGIYKGSSWDETVDTYDDGRKEYFPVETPNPLGVITLYEPIGAGYVAHEINHALLHYMQMHRVTPDVTDEKLCYGISDLTSDFWCWYLDEE